VQRLIISQSEADLTSHAGLGLIGRALNECTNLAADAKAISPLRSGAIGHANILSSSVALLCLGKSDFAAINGFREDPYFATALDLAQVPSEGTLRQRMDGFAEQFKPILEDATIAFLLRSKAQLTPLANGWMPLDCDVTPFDNSHTNKEGVSRGGLFGAGGLRPGIGVARRQSALSERHTAVPPAGAGAGATSDRRPLLLRLDRGNDAIENIAVVEAHNEQDPQVSPTHYVIKWNPRREPAEKWLAIAEERGTWSEPRPGKRVALFDWYETRTDNGYTYSLRRVMRVVERTIDQHGQQLLVPEVTIEGWWTSLTFDEATIIALYADHATSEQFHSEFKTDLDFERLPSGKFATNAVILAGAQLAYNILRWIGQNGLVGPDAPPRHRAKRHRICTVMQELMDLAARLIHTGRRLKLAFGSGCRVVPIFRRLYEQLART